jgi:hypothetical protein
VAVRDGDVVGVCALLRVDAATLRTGKMAVAEHAQASASASASARRRSRGTEAGASRLILESNTVLAPAMALYRKLGFIEVTGIPSEYSAATSTWSCV